VTLDEIKRLAGTGIVRANNIDAFLVGAAANDRIKQQLRAGTASLRRRSRRSSAAMARTRRATHRHCRGQ
jgi:hypothetical protein